MKRSVFSFLIQILLALCFVACNNEEPMDSGVWNNLEEVSQTGLPTVEISTPDQATISKKQWMGQTTVIITSPQDEELYKTSSAAIKGRGNTTWNPPKKPYTINLPHPSPVLGMPSEKRWVLLANFYDQTHLRNELAFLISKQTGLKWTPSGKFVELILNGRHMGNYYLCEQIKNL